MRAIIELLTEFPPGTTLKHQELFGALAERDCIGQRASDAVEFAKIVGAIRERRDARFRIWFDLDSGAIRQEGLTPFGRMWIGVLATLSSVPSTSAQPPAGSVRDGPAVRRRLQPGVGQHPMAFQMPL
ncbi:MAG: hypothetical protein AB7P21_29970 [Lautropia sp.]